MRHRAPKNQKCSAQTTINPRYINSGEAVNVAVNPPRCRGRLGFRRGYTARRTATPPRPPCATHSPRHKPPRHPGHHARCTHRATSPAHHARRGVPSHKQAIQPPHISTTSIWFYLTAELRRISNRRMSNRRGNRRVAQNILLCVTLRHTLRNSAVKKYGQAISTKQVTCQIGILPRAHTRTHPRFKRKPHTDFTKNTK